MSEPDPDPDPRPPGRARGLLAALIPDATPLDLRILGRTLLHAAAVGALAGLVGALFFGGLEVVQRGLLELIAGYKPLRAHGETFLKEIAPQPFRWWVLIFLPALGALVGGILTARFASEARGGGGDAAIEAFHHNAGIVRPRVIWVKALASIFTLGSGGSGGREGPTMHIGAALGSLVARVFGTTARERQILLVAGVAAGMAAVFRTPLGAALLAAEVLYRDDFESDALIPAVLASVVAYSVVISVFGESTLFAHAPRYPFVPAHLPLYGLLALLIAALAIGFVKTLRAVQRITARLPVPTWARPGVGGLALGLLATPVIVIVGNYVGTPGQGLGVMGGGYGAAQMAITGGPWLDHTGWHAVEILLLLCGAKILAASLTIGSGGSAGDFAPSLVLGALFGGAFGHVLQLVLHDPCIDPGAFALVGMGTFYGGIAHVPLSALVLTCELAGSYDLLVPLMLAEGVAFVALRRHTLYPAQLPSRQQSAEASALDRLGGLRVREVMVSGRTIATFEPKTPITQVLRRVSEVPDQDVFPVVASPEEKLVGLITPESLRIIAATPEMAAATIAADVMHPPATLKADDDLRYATKLLLKHGLPELPVVDATGRIVGLLGESEVAQAYLMHSRGSGPKDPSHSGDFPTSQLRRPQ